MLTNLNAILAFPGGTGGREPACQYRRRKRLSFNPWVGKMPWRGAWQPTSVLLPGGCHGQGSLAGYSYRVTELDLSLGLPRWRSGKESACQCRRHKRRGFNPWVRMLPWRRKWQPTPVFLPGKFHGQRSLAGYSPWGRKESDATDHTHAHTTRVNRFTKYGFGNIQATINAWNSCHLGAGTAPTN